MEQNKLKPELFLHLHPSHNASELPGEEGQERIPV